MPLKITNRISIGSGGGGGLHPSYRAVYDLMAVKPSVEIAKYQNNLVKTLINSGVFPSKVVRLFILGNHSIQDSPIDFVDPTRYATPVGNPEFEANKGYTGYLSGSTRYFNLNFNPSTETDKYTQNSAGFGVYIQNNVDGSYSDIGASDGTRYTFLNPRNVNLIHTDINEAVGGYNTGIANTDSSGFYFVTRRGADGSTKKYVYKNRVKTTLSTNSTGVPTKGFFGLCYNGNNTPTQISSRQNGLIIITSGLTDEEENILSDAINLYFSQVATATFPYYKGADQYKATIKTNTVFYLDGKSVYPIIGPNYGTETGTPNFNADKLTIVETGKAVALTAGQLITFPDALKYQFTLTSYWSCEFLIKYTTAGTFISKVNGALGWYIAIDSDGRLKANLHSITADDKCESKSTEVLQPNTIYHCVVKMRPRRYNPNFANIVIIINGREQIPYPQYDVYNNRQLTTSTTFSGNLVIGSAEFEGTLDEIIINNNLGYNKGEQQRAWMAMYSSFAMPTWNKPTTKVNLILDQDIDSDPDDAGDIHTAIALNHNNEVNLLGDIISCATAFSAPAAQAIADWWESDVPIAAYQGNEGRDYSGSTTVVYKHIRDQFRAGDIKTNYPDDLITYRTLLASIPDGTGVIVTTGYLISLQRLMNSPADGISPLTGMQLLQTKVDTIFVVDNFYPSGNIDATSSIAYNGSGHPASWKDVIENAPCKMIFSGAELALSIVKGAPIKDPDDYLTNPFRYAFWYNSINSRPVWGVLPQIIAARGLQNDFILSHPFTQTINGITGLADNLVYSQSGNRWFLRFADDTDSARLGNTLTTQVDTIFAMDKNS